MLFTRKQKQIIRAHWAHLELRFCRDGSVMARNGNGHSWGVLYTARQAIDHIKTIGK